MTPYYDDGTCVIYHGDCREVLPGPDLAAEAALVVADPPYGDTSLAWDSLVPGWPHAVVSAVPGVASMWVFGSLRMFMASAADLAGWRMSQEVIWEKHNGSSFHADRFKRVHETVAHFYREATPWAEVYKAPVTTADATARAIRKRQQPPHTGTIGEVTDYRTVDGGPRLMRSVIYVRSCNGYAVHPTQKPEGLVRPLLEYGCPPGGVVLDPFMGSGTTLRVAKDSGRRAVGIEDDERYCEIAARRLQQESLALETTP